MALGLFFAGAILGSAVTTRDALGGGLERAQAAAGTGDVIARFDPVPLASLQTRIDGIANVADWSPRLTVRPVDIGTRRGDGERRTGTAEANGMMLDRPVQPVLVVAGRWLSGKGDEVVVERGLFTAWHLRLGQELVVRGGAVPCSCVSSVSRSSPSARLPPRLAAADLPPVHVRPTPARRRRRPIAGDGSLAERHRPLAPRSDAGATACRQLRAAARHHPDPDGNPPRHRSGLRPDLLRDRRVRPRRARRSDRDDRRRRPRPRHPRPGDDRRAPRDRLSRPGDRRNLRR